MGNFHCIPNNCARVVYRPYIKGGGLRYRYEGEEWTYVDGDDYSLDEKVGQCYTGYTVTFDVQISRAHPEYLGNNQWAWTEIEEYTQSYALHAPSGWKIENLPNLVFPDFNYQGGNYTPSRSGYLGIEMIIASTSGSTQSRYIYTHPLNAQSGSYYVHFFQNISNIGVIPLSEESPDCAAQCKFTITKNNQAVYEETRSSCPEVEILDSGSGCQLSETYQQLKIEKTPFLQRVEVRDKAVDIEYIGAVPTMKFRDIPEHMLIVYKTLITAPLELSEFVPAPGFINPYIQVAVIESEANCPPPEYEVICDCDCRPCPDGTCAIECDGHVCCNDTTTGKLIDSIPSEEYCEVV